MSIKDKKHQKKGHQNIDLYSGGYIYKMKNKRLKIARVECDLSQEELAKRVGVTRQTIGAIENGSYNPTLKLCLAICKVTGKTLNDLFWEEQAE